METQGFAVGSSKDQYVLGPRDMVDKSASTCLSTFKTVLDDIEAITTSNVGKHILTNIKNTLSDRATSEKMFHTLLEECCHDVLPEVLEN